MIIHNKKINDNFGQLVYSCPPIKRTIYFSPSRENVQQKPYFLSLPHQLFNMLYYEEAGYFRIITAMNGFATTQFPDQVFYSGFTNHSEFPINIGEKAFAKISIIMNYPPDNFTSTELFVKQTINEFYSQIFTSEGNKFYNKDFVLSSYQTWAVKTKENPRWIPELSDFIPFCSFLDFANYYSS